MPAESHVWWYTARAAGVVSWALLVASITFGFLLATRILGRRPAPKWLLDLHRFVGGLAVIFVGVHLLGLWLDQYVGFTAGDLFVPFVSGWRPWAVTLGIVSFYVLVAIEVTSLLMKHLPKRAWRAIHISSYALFAVSTLHSLLAGSDTRNLLLVVALVVASIEVGGFVLVRIAQPSTAGASGTDRPPVPATLAHLRSTARPVAATETGTDIWPDAPPVTPPTSWRHHPVAR